jgi:hypothetical protein
LITIDALKEHEKQKRKTRNYRIMDFEVTDGKVLPTNVEKSSEKC